MKEDKKEHILDTAEKVFAELGFEGASTRTLANAAGVNLAMLNYYFGSKDGLLQAVLARRIAGTRQALTAIKEQGISPEEKLYQAVDLYLAKVAANNGFHRIIMREISMAQRSELGDSLANNMLMNQTLFCDIIREGIEKQVFRPVDVEMTVSSIFGTLFFIVNSRQVSSRLLNVDFQDRDAFQNQVKPRIRQFIYDYLTAYLLIK